MCVWGGREECMGIAVETWGHIQTVEVLETVGILALCLFAAEGALWGEGRGETFGVSA